MPHPGKLRTFGSWGLYLVDVASGKQEWVNESTGEVSAIPPAEVEAVLLAEMRQPLYDYTPHRFVDLGRGRCCRVVCRDTCGSGPVCKGEVVTQPNSCDAASLVQRVDLWETGSDTAFLLRNLLSSEECDEITAQAEYFGLQDTGYSHRIRVNDRVAVMGEDLGALLFERARAFLEDITIPEHGVALSGIPKGCLKGLWQPTGLNECFRACRYAPGGFFRAHFDEGFYRSDTHLSLKTFMIYLNDDFEGGATNFYSEKQQHYTPGHPDNLIYALRPEKGSCVVFNHNITHDGGEMKTGFKYILRTEVMYEHVSTMSSGHLSDGSDSDFENEGQPIIDDLF
jgi:hypothetical protein